MKNLTKFYLLGLLFISEFTLFAQEPGDEDEFGNLEGGDPLPGAPINSKLIYLAITGIVFAFYIYNRNKKRNLIQNK